MTGGIISKLFNTVIPIEKLDLIKKKNQNCSLLIISKKI